MHTEHTYTHTCARLRANTSSTKEVKRRIFQSSISSVVHLIWKGYFFLKRVVGNVCWSKEKEVPRDWRNYIVTSLWNYTLCR